MPQSTIVASLGAVSKRLGGKQVLVDLDLALEAGGVTTLLGPNGAGKTTSVGLLTGRLEPDAGEARLFGRPPTRPEARRRLGVMLQSATLPETLTVAEQIALFAGYYPDPRPVSECVRLAGLDGLERRRCQALSGGQQRRLQFALAICGRPDLLVLDEPTAGLDHDGRRGVWQVVREAAGAGAAVLLTTHHLDEAEALADRVVVMAEGRIVADGTADAIKGQVAGTLIRCRTKTPLAVLSALPMVVRTEHNGAEALLLSSDAVATLRHLLAAAPDLHALSVESAGLEQALQTLTTQDIAEAA